MKYIENFIGAVLLTAVIFVVWIFFAATGWTITDVRSIITLGIVAAIVLGIAVQDEHDFHYPRIQTALVVAFFGTIGFTMVWGLLEVIGVGWALVIGIPTILIYRFEDFESAENLSLFSLPLLGSITGFILLGSAFVSSIRWFGNLDPSRVVVTTFVGFGIFVIAFVTRLDLSGLWIVGSIAVGRE